MHNSGIQFRVSNPDDSGKLRISFSAFRSTVDACEGGKTRDADGISVPISSRGWVSPTSLTSPGMVLKQPQGCFPR